MRPSVDPMNASPEDRRSYDPQFFRKIAAVEDKHFWFCARNRIIAAAVQSVIKGLQPGYRVLEVGCGTGIVLHELRQVCANGEVIGMDLYPEAVALASQRAGCSVIAGDILNPPDLGKFHIVGIFDVLEHLRNDREILCGLNRILEPGGTLILTVPSRMSLWSYFDIASCHRRRYEDDELRETLSQSGFHVEYLTGFMMSLFPLVWLFRRARRGRAIEKDHRATEKATTELKIIPILNGFLKAVLMAEAIAVRNRLRLPFGTSLLAVARKQ